MKASLILLTALLLFSFSAIAQQCRISTDLSFTTSTSENATQLRWTMQKEVNTKYFIVEQSPNEKDYEAIALVAAKGYSITPTNYEFEAYNEFQNEASYRVTLVDMMGLRYCIQTDVKHEAPLIIAVGDSRD